MMSGFPLRSPQAAGSTRDVRALAVFGLVLLLVAVGLLHVLTQSAQRRSGTNGVWPSFEIGQAGRGTTFCQGQELLPAGTVAIQLQAAARSSTPPRLDITLSRHGHLLARTSAVPHVGGGFGVDAPIQPTTRDLDDVEVCVHVGAGSTITLVGGPTPQHTGRLTVAGQAGNGSIPISYLRAGKESWLSYASAVTARIGLGRGSWGGGWIVWLLAALLAGVFVLTVLTVLGTVVTDRGAPGDDDPPAQELRARLRRALRRVPAAGWAIAAIAVMSAVAWSLITPAFQVPDENTHFAYVQQVAETGRPPADRDETVYSKELQAAMGDVRFGVLARRTYRAAVWSPLQQRRLERDLRGSLSRHGNGGAGPAAPEPPLYYAAEAIPYRLASTATLLDRLALMRLVSALMAGITALFAFLFVRECMPGRAWAWSVGGLGVALTPTLGFVSGGVNPDALLFAVSAATFFCLARVFRRGLTTRRAIWLGVVVAIGVVGKINYYGMVPGVILAVALAARATEGAWNRRTAQLVGIVVGIGVAPYLIVTALDALAWERPFILARTPAELPEDHGGLEGQLSYLWQVFFPRLPGQRIAIPEFHPAYDLWFKGFVGSFGWVIVYFSAWVYRVAAVVFAAICALALWTLRADRVEVRRRRRELLGYALVAGGLLLLIGLVALRGWAPGIVGAIQGRYLLPLLALFGGVLALAARGVGERWGRAVGAAIVAIAIAWTLFAQLLTIAFFYS